MPMGSEGSHEVGGVGMEVIGVAAVDIVDIIRKTLERHEINKNGRGTEQHLPKTDESIVRPVGGRR